MPGLCLIMMMFVNCDSRIGTALLCLTLFFNAAVICTTIYNPQDLAPNFAATVYGIISTIGGVSQFLVPVSSAVMTKSGVSMMYMTSSMFNYYYHSFLEYNGSVEMGFRIGWSYFYGWGDCFHYFWLN